MFEVGVGPASGCENAARSRATGEGRAGRSGTLPAAGPNTSVATWLRWAKFCPAQRHDSLQQGSGVFAVAGGVAYLARDSCKGYFLVGLLLLDIAQCHRLADEALGFGAGCVRICDGSSEDSELCLVRDLVCFFQLAYVRYDF